MKKILVMACSVIILAAIAISGTIAYFTDSDNATNVFTVGNVVIKLNEQQRGLDDKKNPVPDSTLKPFEDNKNLMPLVGEINDTNVDGKGLPTAKNFQDKIVTVTNTGKSDAYVRVYVGVPAELDKAEPQKALHFVDGSKYNTTNNLTLTFGTPDKIENQTVGTEKYNFYCFTLNGALPKDATTGAAIVGFYLDSAVDYKDEDKSYYIGDKSVATNKLNFDLSQNVEIPVYVQAVQTAGFENNAATAFGTAFTQYPWGGSSSETPGETTPSATPSATPGEATPSATPSATPTPAPTVDTSKLSTLQPVDTDRKNYEINTATELFAFAKMVNDGTDDFSGKTVKLMNNISLSNQQDWAPIGKSKWVSGGTGLTRINSFKGTFDGNNKTIYHLTFDYDELDDDGKQEIYSDYYAQGLFGYCEGTIQNLTLDGAKIVGENYTGGIAGYLGSGEIKDCTVRNSEIRGRKMRVRSGDIYAATVGAIVGEAGETASLTSCTVDNCNVYGEQGEVGRIAGSAYENKVTNCTATNSTAYYRDGNSNNEHEIDTNIGKINSAS